ncbi:hypothetical protein [Aquabacterium sp.]|uniref:hypothetical protein n=1 Tax=Aquabacterium sp. TaxID=1872578 RepID=UPI00378480FE
MKHPIRTLTRLALPLLLSALPLLARAQNYEAMIQRQMQAMNQNIARGQQMVNNVVQQRMQDPSVQAGYQQYLQQMAAAGRQPMNYQTYAYYHVYTNGFSAQGMAHMRNTESGIQAREQASWQGWQQAQAQRGQAQQAWRDGYYRNQQEAGRGLMGQSTYTAGNGSTQQLPHTWQRNTMNEYQGQTYYVDASGQYFQRGADGYWYPLAWR